MVRWGIIGLGKIARVFANEFKYLDHAVLNSTTHILETMKSSFQLTKWMPSTLPFLTTNILNLLLNV